MGGGANKSLSGFLVQELVPELQNKWHLHTGGLVANHLDNIGKDIDLCIIDTVHSAPGEVLDFLMVLPYLSKNAVIIMHDLVFHIFAEKNSSICALLFQALQGRKVFPPFDEPLQNIGSCVLADLTPSHIQQYFRILNFPWCYIPNDKDLQVFRNWIVKHYEPSFSVMFDRFVEIQRKWQKRENPLKRATKKLLKKIIPQRFHPFAKRIKAKLFG
ncbi:class I SAM-dependent methyltransferase [Helicobacter fennelliae]|uniref:Class I SAM-dependent methyltransferase n=1 Tax=Helicobacter fennelliae MRY12-0050 TaxID=1325130 RepID=T1CML7_9HELI|nr:class I SAM-dependent methyltransferase [Helicobacter fennelliae]GAD17999.1 hypothetical protein HFN_1558 [Helicobacter fennelliae MRY12-0050]